MMNTTYLQCYTLKIVDVDVWARRGMNEWMISLDRAVEWRGDKDRSSQPREIGEASIAACLS